MKLYKQRNEYFQNVEEEARFLRYLRLLSDEGDSTSVYLIEHCEKLHDNASRVPELHCVSKNA